MAFESSILEVWRAPWALEPSILEVWRASRVLESSILKSGEPPVPTEGTHPNFDTCARNSINLSKF